jgi:hypothetical protein
MIVIMLCGVIMIRMLSGRISAGLALVIMFGRGPMIVIFGFDGRGAAVGRMIMFGGLTSISSSAAEQESQADKTGQKQDFFQLSSAPTDFSKANLSKAHW